MRAVLQRVTSARVEVDGEVVGAIDRPGLLALVGVTHDDGPEQVERMARKIAELRILRDEASLTDAGAPVLVVSQFTLHADTRKGRRPSWSAAAPGTVAEPLVADLVAALRGRGIEVETGRFGAMMQVSLVNDGPFTLVVDALRHPEKAYVAAGKRTRTFWLVLLGAALAIGFVTLFNPLSIFGLLAFVGAAVYLADVRPALRQVRGIGGRSNTGW